MVKETAVTDLHGEEIRSRWERRSEEDLKFSSRKDSSFERKSDSCHKGRKFVNKSDETNPSTLIFEVDAVTLRRK